MTGFAEDVLKLVAVPSYKPITVKTMARRLEIASDRYAEFRAAVKQLVKEGKLDLGKDKTLRPPDRTGMIVGLFRRSAKGFGFVRPHGSDSRIDQIYIPPEASRDASSGDEVAVKITKRSRQPGMSIEGRIVKVLREPRLSSSAPILKKAMPASCGSTVRPSTIRFMSVIPAPRVQSQAIKWPWRWCATPRLIWKEKGSSPKSSAREASRASIR